MGAVDVSWVEGSHSVSTEGQHPSLLAKSPFWEALGQPAAGYLSPRNLKVRAKLQGPQVPVGMYMDRASIPGASRHAGYCLV